MSPYGMKGGDTPEADKWMEGCVAKVMGQKDKSGKPYDKSTAIAICKSTYEKSKGDKGHASFILEQIFYIDIK